MKNKEIETVIKKIIWLHDNKDQKEALEESLDLVKALYAKLKEDDFVRVQTLLRSSFQSGINLGLNSINILKKKQMDFDEWWRVKKPSIDKLFEVE